MNRVSKILADFVISKAPHMDEERGAVPTEPAPQQTVQPEARSAPVAAARFEDAIPAQVREQLRVFRHLIGITTDPSLGSPLAPGTVRPDNRAAPNLGLYTRIVRNEQIAKTSYKYYSVIINGCLGTQIIVAAALTAMGAADSNHNAVTAFGAINTIIAGFLTYLKGSGLPNRLRFYQNEWKKLREYIEQRERDLSRPSGAYLDVYAIVSLIERMYEETKTDIEVNTPDGYISISNIRKRPGAGEHHASFALTNTDTTKTGPHESSSELLRPSSIASKLKGFEASLAEKLHEVENKGQDAGRDLEKGEQTFSARIRELRGSIDDRVRGMTASIDQSTKDVASDIQSQGRQTSSQAREMEHDAVAEVSRDIQDHAKRKIDELAARLSR